MRDGMFGRGARIAAMVAIFGAGFLCGSASQRSANAQLGDVMKKAGDVGSVGDMGSAITDMQSHVEGLQKNLDTFKKVKSALGG